MSSKVVVISVFSTVFKIVLAIIIVMLVYKWSMTAYEYGQRVFNEPPMSAGSGRTVAFVVKEGETAKEIGANLEKNGLIRDAALFRIQEMPSAYKDEMKKAGFDIKPTQSAICAVMLYDAKLSQDFAAELQKEGIYVTGFYYPVVPKGQARIRVQVSAAHEKEHLDRCIAAFTKIGKQLGVIK